MFQSVFLEVVVHLEISVLSLQILERGDSPGIVCRQRRALEPLSEDLVARSCAGGVVEGFEDTALDLAR